MSDPYEVTVESPQVERRKDDIDHPDPTLDLGRSTVGDDGAEPGPRVRADGPAPAPGIRIDTALVVGHRPGPDAHAVLRCSVDLANRLAASVHVVHAIDLSDYPVDPDAADWEEQARRTLAREQRSVEQALSDVVGSWTFHAGHGDPVRLLRDTADSCDAMMFVVGSRGEGAGSAISRLLGVRSSVSHGLIARSHRPVLVVPPHATDTDPV